RVPRPVPQPRGVTGSVRPREVEGRDTGVEIERQRSRGANEWQAEMFRHGPASQLALIDDEGIDALVVDRGRGVPKNHRRAQDHTANGASEAGDTPECAQLRVEPSDRPRRETLPADLVVFQARGPHRPLEVGDLEVDDFVSPRLEPPPKGRDRMEVP